MTLRETLEQLLKAADQFETKTPQYKKIETERQALREAITHTQLVLSIQPPRQEKPTKPGSPLRVVPRRKSQKTDK